MQRKQAKMLISIFPGPGLIAYLNSCFLGIWLLISSHVDADWEEPVGTSCSLLPPACANNKTTSPASCHPKFTAVTQRTVPPMIQLWQSIRLGIHKSHRTVSKKQLLKGHQRIPCGYPHWGQHRGSRQKYSSASFFLGDVCVLSQMLPQGPALN